MLKIWQVCRTAVLLHAQAWFSEYVCLNPANQEKELDGGLQDAKKKQERDRVLVIDDRMEGAQDQ
jgi:hypothetical protein